MSDIELSKLIARASLLTGLGGLSDAIHFNALEPKIAVSALGDVMFTDEFGELVVEPMLRNLLGRKFVSEAPKQAKRYSEFVPVESSENLIEEEFQTAWEGELGFTIDDGRLILDAIEGCGIKKGKAVFQLTTSAFLELMSEENISSDKGRRFLDQFSLSPREAWSNPGTHYVLKDIYPWRYGRRLSFALRPILRLDDGLNPDLLIAPDSLRSGFAYFVDGTYSGRFDQSFYTTPRMRDLWWGKASEGHTFNSAVARDLEEAGWTVRDNIELTEILAAKLDRDYGDVDVLAWKENSVLIVECKDLSLARNYSEVASLLSNYQGVIEGGKRDALRKHLDRVEKLKVEIAGLSKFVQIVEPEIHSCLICSGSVPMQFAKIEALNGTFVGSVKELLSHGFFN